MKKFSISFQGISKSSENKTIYLAISHYGVNRRISTTINIKSTHWDKKNKRVKKECNSAKEYNKMLVNQKNKLLSIYNNLEAKNIPYTIEELVKKFNFTPYNYTVVKLVNEVLSDLKKSLRPNHYHKLRTLQNNIEAFLDTKYDINLSIANLGDQVIKDFETYLSKVIENSPFTVHKKHKNLRKILYHAIKMELIEKIPFQYVCVEPKKNKPVSIPNTQIPDEERKYYVYLHINNISKEIFYIGKGTRKRAYTSCGRNIHWHNYVKNNLYDIVIHKSNLTEKQAYSLENELLLEHKQNDALVNIMFPTRKIKCIPVSNKVIRQIEIETFYSSWIKKSKELYGDQFDYSFVNMKDLYAGKSVYVTCMKHMYPWHKTKKGRENYISLYKTSVSSTSHIGFYRDTGGGCMTCALAKLNDYCKTDMGKKKFAKITGN